MNFFIPLDSWGAFFANALQLYWVVVWIVIVFFAVCRQDDDGCVARLVGGIGVLVGFIKTSLFIESIAGTEDVGCSVFIYNMLWWGPSRVGGAVILALFLFFLYSKLQENRQKKRPRIVPN